jgi:putative FmdB family regulatory protein
MPLYEYQCDACGHQFEKIQKFSDPVVDVCPKCGGAVKKLLSSPAIQFKGTGWYITDYARSGKTDSAATPGETKTESKTESKTDTKTDSKTDSKPETKSEPSKTETKGTP